MDGEKISNNVLSPGKEEVIYCHKNCQTRNAKWMCIEDLYEKFHRQNFYDIGGTYIEDVADFWFIYKTEQVGSIFLMHLFIMNRQAGTFNVALSYNSELNIDEKNNYVSLSPSLTEYEFKDRKDGSQLYICTYNFTDVDIALIKDKRFYIALSFHSSVGKSLTKEVIDEIKANHDFRELLNDPIGADFTMESAEGTKFQAHKVLLSVHSEVFKAMLKEDTAESQNSYVKLVNIPTEDLSHILEFIYTGTITDTNNCNFFSLLMLADQYNIQGLRELSQYALAEQLTVENAIEILVVSDMYNSEALKFKVLRFIKKHLRAFEVLNSKAGGGYSSLFKDINNPALVKELCEFIAL